MVVPLFPSPSLLGLGYSVVRRSKGSTSIQEHVSGREVRVGYWTYPMYEWELTFNVLRDFERGAVPSELKRLQGHFLAAQGSLSGFTFDDKDDNSVTNQFIGVTDGNPSTPYLVVRTYGDPGYGATVTEPIGKVAIATNVYLNGIPQLFPDDWTNDYSVPYRQRIFFSHASSGFNITADVSGSFTSSVT